MREFKLFAQVVLQMNPIQISGDELGVVKLPGGFQVPLKLQWELVTVKSSRIYAISSAVGSRK